MRICGVSPSCPASDTYAIRRESDESAGQRRRPRHSFGIASNRRRGGTTYRLGGERDSAALPPRRQFFPVRVDRAALVVREPMDGQPLFTLPSLYGANAATQVCGDFLPGVEPLFERRALFWRSLAVRPVRHETASLAQTCAKTRHAPGDTS